MSHRLMFHHFGVLLGVDGEPWILGEGNFGTTYKAIDTRLHRLVALKVLKTELLVFGPAKEKFEREARAAASFQHPNVATVHYFGEQDGACFYAMEFVEGADVESYVGEHGPFGAHDALAIAAQVASALAAAHAEGLVHRDVKPSNIVLSRTREGTLMARLIDFGLLSLGTVAAARGDRFEGTPLYASPEQFDGATLDARSDVYSLGATMFFMLVGHAPFRGTFVEVEAQHLLQPLPIATVESVSPAVGAIVAKMMDKDPFLRPQSGRQALAEIESVLRAIRGSSAQTAVEWMAAEYTSIERAAVLAGGAVYHVARKRGDEELIALYFDASAIGSAAASEWLTLHAGLNSLTSDCFRSFLQLVETADGMVAVLEPLRGTRLLSVLRVRRSLPPREALLILEPLALAIDEAFEAGLMLPHIGLRNILLRPPDEPCKPLHDWRYLRPTIDLIGVGERDIADVNATVDSALPRSMPRPAIAPGNQSADALIAALIYETVGGRTIPSSGHYIPLAELSESANAALRRASEGSGKSGGAGPLLAEVFPKQSAPSVSALTLKTAPAVAQASLSERPRASSRTIIAASKGGSARWTITRIGSFFLFFVLAVAFYVFIKIFADWASLRLESPVDMARQSPPEDARSSQREEALAGDDQAQLRMGLDFRGGRGVARDDAEAVRWFRKAAEQGNAEAKNALGIMYLEGRGVARNDAEAYRMLQSSAQQGDAEGQFLLAKMYLKGVAVSKNETSAEKYFRLAADQGHAGAKAALVSLPSSQVTVPKVTPSGPPQASLPAPSAKVSLDLAARGPYQTGQPVEIIYRFEGGGAVDAPSTISAGGLVFRLVDSRVLPGYSRGELRLDHGRLCIYEAVPATPGKFVLPKRVWNLGGKSITSPAQTIEVRGPPREPSKKTIPAGSETGRLKWIQDRAASVAAPAPTAVPLAAPLTGASIPVTSATQKSSPSSQRRAPTTADGQPAPYFGEIITGSSSTYVGEVVPVELRFYFRADISFSDLQRPSFGGDGFTAAPLSEPEQTQQFLDNIPYNVVTFRSTITPVKVGQIEIPPAAMEGRMMTGAVPQAMDPFLGQSFRNFPMPGLGRAEFIEARTGTRTLEVKALPR